MRLLLPALLVLPFTLCAADLPGDQPLVQVAILLDDSGSMQGLLRQARSQVWEIVGQLSAMRRDGRQPRVQVALYHYGDVRALDRPLVGLTDDLDEVSRQLFAVNGGGGEERCGQVILNSTAQLSWSQRREDLKLILIAGNEPFTQGPVEWRTALQAATGRGLSVTTIHCGPDRDGREGSWADAAELGGGRYLCIEQDRALPAITAPQDPDLRRLNGELNATYLPYGGDGESSLRNQSEQDGNALASDPKAYAKRSSVKAGSSYSNGRWDLVDALRDDPKRLEALKDEELPPALRGLARPQQLAQIAHAAGRRKAIQDEIVRLTVERDRYVAAEEARLTEGGETYGGAARKAIAGIATAAGWTAPAER